MAPARSIQCIKRPPRSAPRGFASLGRTSSAISDCDSRTRRGVRGLVSFMDRCGDRLGVFRRSLSIRSEARFGKPRLEEACGHLLDSRVRMATEPATLDNAVLEATVLRGQVILLAHVRQANAGFVLACHSKSDCVPFPFLGQTWAIRGIPQV